MNQEMQFLRLSQDWEAVTMSAAYEAIAWLKPECDFDLARAAALVKEWLPGLRLDYQAGLMISK